MGTKRLSGCGAALLALSAPALAVDGVREINQVCAETTGCFTGDTASFPVTITQGGAYRLTSNLSLVNANTDGIVIATADVSIDLNGFRISGITTCSGTPTTCTSVGVGRGVAVGSTGIRGLSVRNGTVSQMGAIGVYLGEAGTVEDVRALSNGSQGIFGGAGAQILRCMVARNGEGGIHAGENAVVADNAVQFAGGTEAGISVSNGVVRGNSVYGGASHGIRGDDGTTIVDNTSVLNSGRGIWSGDASTISRNSVQGPQSGDIAISAEGSRISENSILTNVNSATPIVAPDCGCAGNVIQLFGPAPFITGCVNLGGNLCNGAPCP